MLAVSSKSWRPDASAPSPLKPPTPSSTLVTPPSFLLPTGISEPFSVSRKLMKLLDEFSTYATSPLRHLTTIAGAFYESVALNRSMEPRVFAVRRYWSGWSGWCVFS